MNTNKSNFTCMKTKIFLVFGILVFCQTIKAQSIEKIKTDFTEFVLKYDNSFNISKAKIEEKRIIYSKLKKQGNQYLDYVFLFDEKTKIVKYKAIIFNGDNENKVPLSEAFGNNPEIISLFNAAIPHYSLNKVNSPNLGMSYVILNNEATNVTFPYIKISDGMNGCIIYSNNLDKFETFDSAMACWNY